MSDREITKRSELYALKAGAAVLTSDAADEVVLKGHDGIFRNQDAGEVSIDNLWAWGAKPFTILWEPEA